MDNVAVNDVMVESVFVVVKALSIYADFILVALIFKSVDG